MSRTKAIEEFCKACIYDPTEAGSWRKQCEECSVSNCPLYAFRPMTIETINANRVKKVKKKTATG